MSNIKIGDVVTLKSGGLQMTVKSIEENDAVCVWYDQNKGGIIMETLPLVMIKKYDNGIRISVI